MVYQSETRSRPLRVPGIEPETHGVQDQRCRTGREMLKFPILAAGTPTLYTCRLARSSDSALNSQVCVSAVEPDLVLFPVRPTESEIVASTDCDHRVLPEAVAFPVSAVRTPGAVSSRNLTVRHVRVSSTVWLC